MAPEKDPLLVRESFVPLSRPTVRAAAGPPSTPAARRAYVAASKPPKNESLTSLLCGWLVEHQMGVSVNLLLLLALVHLFFPRARRRTRKFFDMSYRDPDSGMYARGWDDMYLVFFYVVVFTGLRAAVMDYMLMPFAKMGGIRSQKLRTRFAEQSWLVIYCVVIWSLGMYIMYNSPYWMNLTELWTDFPTRLITPQVKWYYLVQFAFWLQQLYVVNIEERRKDYWQMFTHHVFTSALLFTSYGFYQTKVGNVILCLMDVADILLPLAKALNYLRFRKACDATFGIFLVVWFIARHVLYLAVCRSIIVDVPKTMPYGCFASTTGQQVSTDGGSAVLANVLQPFNDPDGLVCFNPVIRYGFLGLLMALQILTLIWFGMIVRVAYSVLSGKSAQDSRSDDEEDVDDELEVDEQEYDDTDPLSDSYDPEVKGARAESSHDDAAAKQARAGASQGKGRNRRAAAPARTSAISIPGHGDHKDLLGRIGCDKPT